MRKIATKKRVKSQPISSKILKDSSEKSTVGKLKKCSAVDGTAGGVGGVSGGLMNQTELAKALQTTRMSLNTWSKEEGFPAAKNGRYDFVAVKEWILSRGKMQGSGRKAESGNFSELRLRLLEQELRLKELQVAEMERDLIKFEEAREICLSAITPLARRVKDLPASMALKVNPSDPAFSKDALRDWSDTTLELIQNQCKILKETV